MTFSITVPGKPVGKQRPRMTKTGHVYTPKQTTDYEARVREIWECHYGTNSETMGPVVLIVELYLAIPKRYNKAERQAAESGILAPMKTPDLDNVVKTIADALNGVAYEDDRQIVGIDASKKWGEEDSVYVEIKEVK